MMKKCSTSTSRSRSRSSGLNDQRKHGHYQHRHQDQDQFMSKQVNAEQNNSINPNCSGSYWKLYENPYFSTSSNHSSSNPPLETDLRKQEQQKRKCSHTSAKQHINIHYHHHHCPPAAPPPDPKLLISKTKMDQIKAQARTQIAELKMQLELEHKMLKRMEVFNRRAAKELTEERKQKQEMERCCEELREEVLRLKGEMEQMRRKILQQQQQHEQEQEEEEKRVQIKHVDTQDLFYKYKHTFTTQTQTHIGSTNHDSHKPSSSLSSSSSTLRITNNNNNKVGVCAKRKVSTTMSQEPKNPHIRRGIKGFVEFPRAVKAMGINGSNLHSHSESHFNPNSSCSASVSGKNRDIATKMECQKAQLRNFLKHKGPFPSTPLMMS